MKLMIISDTHGFYEPTKKAFEIFEKNKSDYMIILGDIVYHGPRNDINEYYEPKKIVDFLNKYANKIIAIKGNCDAEIDSMILNFSLVENSIIFIGNRKIFLTHGHVYNEHNMPLLNERDILIRGHFHIPLLLSQDGVYVASPGSIGVPKANSKPSYIIIDDYGLKIYTLDGEKIEELDF